MPETSFALGAFVESLAKLATASPRGFMFLPTLRFLHIFLFPVTSETASRSLLPSDRDDMVPERHMEVLEFQLFRFNCFLIMQIQLFFNNTDSAVFNHTLFTFIHLNLLVQTSIKGANLFFSLSSSSSYLCVSLPCFSSFSFQGSH